MTYAEALTFLYEQLPVFHRDGAKAIRPGLNNTLRLCEHLGNPHQAFKSIHVGGTNGKGSTSHMLAAILQQAGLRVGLYTSPHLKDFTERIKVNGIPIDKQSVINFISRNKAFILELKPSFFELTVGMAFDEFAKNKVDVAVIEVGLGGRLDSTNVITPILSVITNIAYDHTDLLGNTLSAIANEKAGIIKTNTPVVIGKHQPETDAIFLEMASRQHTRLRFATDTFKVENGFYDDGAFVVRVQRNNFQGSAQYRLQLDGIYQQQNLITVLQAVEELREMRFAISDESIYQGLQHTTELTGLKGRWQRIGQQPLTYCDTGHNPSGIEAIVSCIDSIAHTQLWFVFGCAKDKDVTGMLAHLPVDAHYIFCQANSPRAMGASTLQALASQFNLNGVVINEVNQAIKYARNLAQPEDLVVVGGSTYVVAEIENL
jgi:dihydrofolate synthase/folylpolyglutamate synthase